MIKHEPWHPEAFLQNRWTRKYRTLMETALAESRTRDNPNYARHHIVPESFFAQRSRPGPPGWLPGNPEDPSNLVLLTHREHAQAHLWLWQRMTDGAARDKMALAIQFTLGKMSAKGIPHQVPVVLLERIMREAAVGQIDSTIYTWANKNGEVLEATRWQIEKRSGLKLGSLCPLTRKNAILTCHGWWIVRPGDNPSRPPKHRRPTVQPSKRDPTVYTFTHTDGRMLIGTRWEVERQAELKPKALTPLFRRGKQKPVGSIHGWRVVRNHSASTKNRGI